VSAVRHKPRRREVHRLPTHEEARLLVAVALHRLRDCPLSWFELGEIAGWPKAEVAPRIRSLYDVGLRWRRGQARSLGVTDEGLHAALLVAREGRS
jgi:hypothetical protein